MSPLLWIPLLALLVATILHLIVQRAFPKLGLLDFPQRYGLTRNPLPYPIGIVSVVTFVVFYLILHATDPLVPFLCAGVLLLGLFTFIDDRKPLSPWLRLFIQFFAAFLIVAGGARIYTITNPLEGVIGTAFLPLDTWVIGLPVFGLLPVWSVIFSVLWLIMTINALNWFDGISGQVSTLSVIAYVTIGFLSLSDRVNQPSLALLSFVLAGIALASLIFTFPAPKGILGDTGAMFFGLMIGVLTIYSGGKVATAFLVLGVPLIDFVLVLGRRVFKGVSIAKGNAQDEHLHHRLLSKGWSERQVILLTACIGTAFGFTAIFLSTFQKFIAALLLFLIMLGLSWYSRETRDLRLET